MKLRVLSQYGSAAPSVRARALEWVRRVDEAEVEVFDYLRSGSFHARQLVSAPLLLARAEVRLRRAARTRTDVVFVQRTSSPFASGGLDASVLASGDRSVLDFDDAIQWDWRPGLVGSVRRPSGFLRALAVADVVIAGNALLANWASGFARDVRLIPTCVEPDDYQVKQRYDVRDPPRLGWIGTPSTETYLRAIERPLLELHARTGARLFVLSGDGEPLPRLEKMITRFPWSVEAQAGFGTEVDIGLMPLDDTLWARGKCGYKLLQYAAAGLPAVASPAGANAEIAGQLGYGCALDEDDWLGQLQGLLESEPESLRAAGTTARERVKLGFSYQSWLPQWRSAVLGA